MIYNIDIDGVIGDSAKLFVDYINEKYGTDYSKYDINEYYHNFDEIGLSLDEIVEDIYDNNLSYLKSMDLIPGSKESLERFMDDGKEVRLVTHRYNSSKDITVEWLKEKDIPYDELIIDAPKNKSEINGDIMIDDSAYVLEHFNGASHIPILFPNTYNYDNISDHIVQPQNKIEKTIEDIVLSNDQWNVVNNYIYQNISN
jgi:5'(3')-deoxyribonucleotidase